VTIVVSAGHVDHGKSSLVAWLTGVDPDRWALEKERGLTIDLGFAHLRVGEQEIDFIDLPGHVRFVRNMLAGVGGAEAAMLVVAATEGWKEQTEEHLRIIEALGITHGVVVVSKIDLVDEERLSEVRRSVAERVRRSSLHETPQVLTSTVTGSGMEQLRETLGAVAADCPPPVDRGRPRLWIDRAFTIDGVGTVATGTLTDGQLRTGASLECVPTGERGRVRSVQRHGTATDIAAPGQRTAINIVNIPKNALSRGCALVAPGQWHVSQVLDAELAVAAGVEHQIDAKGAYLMYLGTAELAVRVRPIQNGALSGGDRAPVRIWLPSPLPLLPGDRFVLRDSGRREVVGGGTVLDVDPRLPRRLARPDTRIERVVAEHGWIRADVLERLTGQSRPGNVGSWVVDPDGLARAIQTLTARLTAAGAAGVEVAALDDHDRALIKARSLPGLEVTFGTARLAATTDTALHPWVLALASEPLSPPPPDEVDPADLRRFLREGVVLSLDGVYFHRTAIERATTIVRDLLARNPSGFTVAQARDAFGSTRKHAMPLLSRLDTIGVTRRQGDLRVAGPELGR